MFKRQRIHQIWMSGEYDDVPKEFRGYAEEMRDKNPYWSYYFWGKQEVEAFKVEYFPDLEKVFPGLADTYNGFRYWVQKVDLLRLLILYVKGGVYVDFDMESFEDLGLTFHEDTVYFAEEHPRNVPAGADIPFVSNFLMGASEEEDETIAYLIRCIIEQPKQVYPSKFMEVMNTTGPIAMNRNLYDALNAHYEIIPYTTASPLSKKEVEMDNHLSEKINSGYEMTDNDWQIYEWLTSKMCRGYFYHYYAGTWLKEN